MALFAFSERMVFYDAKILRPSGTIDQPFSAKTLTMAPDKVEPSF